MFRVNMLRNSLKWRCSLYVSVLKTFLAWLYNLRSFTTLAIRETVIVKFCGDVLPTILWLLIAGVCLHHPIFEPKMLFPHSPSSFHLTSSPLSVAIFNLFRLIDIETTLMIRAKHHLMWTVFSVKHVSFVIRLNMSRPSVNTAQNLLKPFI